ncbi:MAG: transposase [Tannerella sp.]|nr:transposase [Tannerella sp.]
MSNEEVALIYKYRWTIELMFKKLKQNFGCIVYFRQVEEMKHCIDLLRFANDIGSVLCPGRDGAERKVSRADFWAGQP